MRSYLFLLLASVCCTAVSGCHVLLPGASAQYRIQASHLDDWQSYGGAWEIENDSIHNNSDERGAKLLTGSFRWTDYTLKTDIKFDGDHGDMGVIIRSNLEEEGVDAYDGYYIGMRTVDGTLVAGRSNYGWMEARPVAMPGGVRASTWYRLTVTAVGCSIAASSQNLSTQQTAWLAFQDPTCVRMGRVGLRSLATGGMWRNISVAPAIASGYAAIASHAALVERPEFPKREADYNRFFRFSTSESASAGTSASPAVEPGTKARLGDLQDLPRTQKTPVVVRGIVTLTAPSFYMQDASGGVLVEGTAFPSINVGDTVEVSGLAQPGLYRAVLTQAKIRPLWSGTPMPPLSVTATQASSGTYDARFIEVEGRLTGIASDTSGHEILSLENAGQSFRAIYRDQPGKLVQKLLANSYLRLRGICVLDHTYTQEITPFAILLRSEDDIQILSGPPWWTPVHVTMLFVGLLLLALLVQVIYFRIQQWKTLAITQERERLAHEIHDTMAQSFAGVGYQIQGIRSSVMRGEWRDSTQIANQLNVAYQLVRRCHEEASQTVAMLASSSSPMKDGLLGELQETVYRIAGDQVKTTTEMIGTPVELNLRLANALLHMGQEAVTNVLRHANASIIRLILAFENDRVRLTVADNGSGFDFTPSHTGFGIQGMQKRVREVGGELMIRTTPGTGTEVIITATLQQTNLSRRLLSLLKANTGSLAANRDPAKTGRERTE